MTEENPPAEVDPTQHAQDILLEAQSHLEDALLREDEDEMWKAVASVNSAVHGLKIAQLTSRVQALEEIVQLLLKDQTDDLRQQVMARANLDADA